MKLVAQEAMKLLILGVHTLDKEASSIIGHPKVDDMSMLALREDSGFQCDLSGLLFIANAILEDSLDSFKQTSSCRCGSCYGSQRAETVDNKLQTIFTPNMVSKIRFFSNPGIEGSYSKMSGLAGSYMGDYVSAISSLSTQAIYIKTLNCIIRNEALNYLMFNRCEHE